jgi:hypothetical protein
MTTGSPGAHMPGAHTGGGGSRRSRRAAIVIGIVIVLLLAFGGGYLLARTDDDSNVASPTATHTRSASPSRATPSETPTQSSTPSATSSPSASPVIEDGRHFVYASRGKADGTWSLTFDLAYFLTDQDAIDACGKDIPNGYCIVNDNPKLRTLPVDRTVIVRYIPVDACCDLRIGNFPAFAEAVNGTAQTDYEPTAPWWIMVVDGHVARIVQQYLP